MLGGGMLQAMSSVGIGVEGVEVVRGGGAANGHYLEG